MGKAREKAKAALALVVGKPKDGDAPTDAPLHGSKPEDEQCASALIKAVNDGDSAEVLACLESLFRHFSSKGSDSGNG